MSKRWLLLSVLVCLTLWAIAGTALADEPTDYRLGMQLSMEKMDQPATLFGDLGMYEDGVKLGLRYRVMPNVYVALHAQVKEDPPLSVEGVYRIPIGLDYANLYGGVGLDLSKGALFNGYLIGGLEAALVFIQVDYHTNDGDVITWGGLRIPIF
ncbi:MAG: hypothetical protein GX047_06840 [Firmicutes bacterium]|jgi:hypothetical protein|nr:hypothetical protein [Bacillota bacterium]